MLAPCARLEDDLEFVGSLIGLTLFLSFFKTWVMKVVKVLKSGYFFSSLIFLVASLFHRETSHSGNLVSSFWFSM